MEGAVAATTAVSIVIRLQTRQSRVQIPAGERYISPLQKHSDQILCPLSLLFNGYQGTFPPVKQQGMNLTTCLLQEPRLIMSEAIPLLALYVCLQSVDRDNCTFLLLMAMVVHKPQSVDTGFSQHNLITRWVHVKFIKWKWSSFCSKFPQLTQLIIIPYCSILTYQWHLRCETALNIAVGL